MIKIYTLITRAMNGSVTMMTHTDSFSTLELAKETEAAVKEANKKSVFPIICEIKESEVFEDRDEIPILHKENEK